MNIKDVRKYFIDALANEEFVIDKTGVKTIELVGSSFIADEPMIFGEPNKDYIKREIQWYESGSLNVNDIPDGPPAIWKQVADKDGYINSNYGYLINAANNGDQYRNTMLELAKNPNSRRAIMIYTRPSMHRDYNYNGRSDFICTNTVQYVIRDNFLHAIVNMRSNDAWAGFRNDKAWQDYVLKKLAKDLNIKVGIMYWQTGSLHLYEKDFYLIDYYSKTGELSIKKSEYRDLYPNSDFAK